MAQRDVNGSTEVKDAWQRIARWFKVSVPEDQFRLVTGASEEEIVAAEDQIDLTFPPEMVASYRLHNGSDERAIFPYGRYLLSLSDIVASCQMRQEHAKHGVLEDAPAHCPVGVRPMWWNLNWIPFTHNSGGDHHCIDLDPAESGSVGQVINFNHEVGAHKVLAPNFATFLGRFAAELESGQYRFDEDDLWLVETRK